ncbi:MFS transporter [Actinoplanes sp. SE50]|uniref:MDR family MFS transporter n=1 Tax=unclassified Actinoplanes TaxID=2626549 RepID=UPI00023EDEAC|nr:MULTISPECIES: MFS transporter [unclassified Actinoplanes]AEV88760.1 Multidrug resistance protein mdtH [Actinoplanes sp. SE50/110]ATO87166.1 MFS transporter [Actinoplanes sp. SE50]SLM04584.1 MFS transporter [Actinoplanes sp. SE50/110]
MRGWLREAAGGLPRQFWFLWTGTLINRIGSFVVPFLSIYLTSERHFTQSQAGLVIGLYGVGGAVGTMTGGMLTDRWGRRPTMLTAQFGAAALMLTLGLTHPYPGILIVTTLLGAFAEGVRPAFGAMMVDIVPERDRVRAFSLNYWAVNLGFALAAIVAGLAAEANFTVLFVADAASTVLTGLITVLLLRETRPAHRPAASGVAPAAGLATALRDRTFLAFMLVNLLTVLVMLQHLSTLPITMLTDGLSAATYGWVIAVNGFLIVAGQLFVPRLIAGRRPHRVLAVAALIMGTGFGLVTFAHAAWMYAVTVVIWTLGEMLQSPSNAATVAALSPAPLRGRYQGLNSLSWSAGGTLAPILGGLVLQDRGTTALWTGCFGLCAVAAAGHLATGPARVRRAALLTRETDTPSGVR